MKPGVVFTTLLVCALSAVAPAVKAAASPDTVIRGKLLNVEGKPPVLETIDHKQIAVSGDEPTRGILNDGRLAGADLEAKGHFNPAGEFLINPIETHAILVHKGDKLYRVTYWCPICSIRTYTPGICVCCQEETHLDLIDPATEK